MSRTTRIPATPRGFAAILELYADAIPGRRYPEIRDHFARVARRAPATLVREGLKAALGARDTPPFPAMVARLFRTADPKLRAALIEHLMRRLGASATTGLATGLSVNVSAIRNSTR